MKMDRRAVLSGVSAAVAAPTAGITAVRRQAPQTVVGANAEAIVGRFIEMIRKTGAPIPTAAPSVRLHTEQSLSSYRNGIVTLPIWETTPSSLRKMMDALAVMGGGGIGGEEFFRAIFNWFIVPHELTHWYEDSLGWEARRLDHYETELRCNRVAVAFWAEQPDGPRRLEQLFRVMDKVIMGPPPFPSGSDPATYFNRNYETLGSNPAAYGWYQFSMFREAWKRRGEATFAQLIRTVIGGKPAAFQPINDFIVAFNRGDWDSAASYFNQTSVIIDDSPPFSWSGHDAFRRWLSQNQAGWVRSGISEVSIAPGRADAVQMNDDGAYVVIPASQSFAQRGERVSQLGRFAFTIARSEGVWRISGWAWADDPRLK